jgi:hypothetical protein
MSAPEATPFGWTFPTPDARKCHWFDADNDRSLCGKYMMLRRDPRQFAPDEGASRDDCAACRRAVDKRKAAT